MPEKFSSAIPWVIKILAVIMGGIISLILSGDIDKDGYIKITRNVILKFLSSVMVGLYIGGFVIEHLDWEHMTHFAQGAVMMSFSVFGMLIMGIVYQSIQFTFNGKTFAEIVSEIKQTIQALLK